ncbi:hydrolase [Sinimarinibacterium thermocellulolyticum]|uniref:Hydrolase n=1 Tax=Sinimarinibacterium thermocellulolyticum TaxID=3170016 RepID=A0ABV2A6R5_9GAMM
MNRDSGMYERSSHGRILVSDFEPHPLLRGPHAQTMVPALLRPTPKLALRRERLELPDGDFVDLAWAGPARGSRLAVLVHGLTGGFQSKYLRGTARELIARGWRVVILQLRGGGDEPNRHARCYHHGDTGDLRHLWRVLRQRDPGVRLAAAGWSLGANVLLKALGEEGTTAPVEAAAAACAPFRLLPCAEKLRRGTARLYQARLLRDLKAIVARKHAAVPAPVDMDAVLAARDFIEFDDRYTAPLNGFRDARDYYERCECGGFVGAIRRPTLIVNARDDPFMTPAVLPRASALAPPVTLEVSRRGGHVGFIAADAHGRPYCWLEPHLADFLDRTVAC